MYGLKAVCSVILSVALLSAVQSGQAEWYYRVIGQDDTASGQMEKICVRDAALSACPPLEENLFSALPEIKKAAESVAPCRVEIKCWSPGNSLPSAPTLYITIGEGRGHNCWGVLYADSLRMAQAEEIPEEPDKVEFVWPIWTWLLSLFGL